MRTALFAFAAVAVVAATPAFAQQLNSDDMKWINQCIRDNKGAAAEEVIQKYCICMNNKMDNNENQSISTWEKTHPAERAACDKESGWK